MHIYIQNLTMKTSFKALYIFATMIRWESYLENYKLADVQLEQRENQGKPQTKFWNNAAESVF